MECTNYQMKRKRKDAHFLIRKTLDSILTNLDKDVKQELCKIVGGKYMLHYSQIWNRGTNKKVWQIDGDRGRWEKNATLTNEKKKFSNLECIAEKYIRYSNTFYRLFERPDEPCGVFQLPPRAKQTTPSRAMHRPPEALAWGFSTKDIATLGEEGRGKYIAICLTCIATRISIDVYMTV